MPFILKNLMKIGDGAPLADGASPKSFWHYASADAMTVIDATDYFLPAINLLKVHDMLWITAATGGTPLHYFSYVNANNGTTIDITDGLQITATDTR
jgi:hypothetical protein